MPIFPNKQTKTISSNHKGFSLGASALSNNGKYYALSVSKISADGTSKRHLIRLFNLDKKDMFRSFSMSHKIVSICFSENVKYFSAWTAAQEIFIWDVKTGKLIASNKLSALSPSDTGLEVLKHMFMPESQHSYTIVVFTKNTLRYITFLPEYAHPLKGVSSKNPFFNDLSCAMCLDENTILIGSEDGSVVLLDQKDAKTLIEVPSNIKSKVLCVFPGGIVFGLETEQIIASFDVTQGIKEVTKLSGSSYSQFVSFSISPTMKTMAACSRGGELLIGRFKQGVFNVTSKTRLWEVFQNFHACEIRLVNFDLHRGLLVSVDEGNQLKLWDITTNQVLLSRKLEFSPISVEFHPTSGQYLLISKHDMVFQYLLTPTGLVLIKSIQSTATKDCHYNCHGTFIMSYSANTIDFYNSVTMSEFCKFESRVPISRVSWLPDGDFSISIVFDDGSEEWRQLTPKEQGYYLKPIQKEERGQTILKKNNYIDNSIYINVEGGYEVFNLHSRDINGTVQTFDSGFVTFGKDGLMILFNSSKLQSHYSKASVLFDEIFTHPNELEDLDLRSKAIMKAIQEDRAIYRQKNKVIVDAREYELDDLKQTQECEILSQSELVEQTQVALQTQTETHKSYINDIMQSATKEKTQKEREYEQIILSLKAEIEQIKQSIRMTEDRMQRTKDQTIERYRRDFQAMESDFQAKNQNLIQSISNTKRLLETVTQKYKEYEQALPVEVDAELDELDYEFLALIAKEEQANKALREINNGTESQLLQVAEDLKQVKKLFDDERQNLKRIQDEIDEKNTLVKQLREQIASRQEITREKDILLADVESTLVSNEKACFLLQSQLKLQQENIRPQVELYEQKKAEYEAMQEEVLELQKERTEKSLALKKLQRLVRISSEHVSQHHQQLINLRDYMQQVSKRLAEGKFLTQLTDQQIFIKNFACNNNDPKVEKGDVENDGHWKVKSAQRQLNLLSDKEKRVRHDLNSQRLFLMQELSDLKRILNG